MRYWTLAGLALAIAAVVAVRTHLSIVVVLTALSLAVLWVSAHLTVYIRQSTVDPLPDEPPADSSLKHATALVAWAQGTARDWDRHVRPILGGYLNSVLGHDGRRTGELLFGARLWPLVDPNRQLPGPGWRPG